MKFSISASGTVESRRHRTLEVYAKDEESALEKAREIFIKAINRSKINEESLKDITIKINSDK